MKVQNYLLNEEIGSGSFSTVYKAVDINDQNKVYAIKSMREIPQNDEKVVRNEIQLLKEIKHKNVVNYVTDFKEKGKWYIVFQYCGKGDLQNYFKKQGKLPQVFCKNLAFSIIEALSQLHEKGIAHRDLKLSNILINDEYDFKIADFGMAKIEKDGILQSYCGTPYAMAPQVMKKQAYDTKCDTWSLGIMLYQLLFGKLPFDNRKHGGGMFGLTIAVLQDQPNYELPDVKVSDDCKHFIKLCLKKNPKERPTMKALAGHPWLSIGVGSLIRKDFLKDSLKDNSEVIKRTREIFSQAAEEHIRRLVKNYRLIDTEIASYLGVIQKYYKDNSQIKTMMLLMISKIISQLSTKEICIEIDVKKFNVSLLKVKAFKNHTQNLKSFLVSQLAKLNITEKAKIERNIIHFVINEAQTCLNLTENFPDKINLLRYLSKLPINCAQKSVIKLKWSFNEESVHNQKMFDEYLDKLNQDQIQKYINQHHNIEEGENNWLVQHQFLKVRRQGTEIQLGEYISKVIDINSPPCEL